MREKGGLSTLAQKKNRDCESQGRNYIFVFIKLFGLTHPWRRENRGWWVNPITQKVRVTRKTLRTPSNVVGTPWNQDGFWFWDERKKYFWIMTSKYFRGWVWLAVSVLCALFLGTRMAATFLAWLLRRWLQCSCPLSVSWELFHYRSGTLATTYEDWPTQFARCPSRRGTQCWLCSIAPSADLTTFPLEIDGTEDISLPSQKLSVGIWFA